MPPFKITPDAEFFFEGGNRGAILEALIYAVQQGEGIVKVTGEVGSGKTMLCRVLQQRLGSNVDIVYLANPNVAPDEILHAIAFELQIPVNREASRLEVMHGLQTYLLDRHSKGKQVVVFVEESQSMPIASLEEIRLLSNLETNRHKLLQIVLFGQPELDENLRATNIRQLRERITHSFYLAPLSPEEIRDYLAFRLHAAGYRGPELFSQKVIRHIAKASAGLTRRVNIIADKALLAAFADNTHTVTPKHIRTAVADSEFGALSRAAAPMMSRIWLYFAVGAVGLAVAAAIGWWWFQGREMTLSLIPSNANYGTSNGAPGMARDAIRIESGARAENDVIQAREQTASSQPMSSASLATSIAGADETGLLERRLRVSDLWLAAQDDAALTLYLGTAGSAPELEKMLRDLSNYIDIEKIFVYRSDANSKTMRVIYDSFADAKTARQAINSLPAEVQRLRPVARSLSAIRTEVAGSRPVAVAR